MHLHRERRHGAGKRQHRADRQVDVAGGDDIGEPDREQRQLGIVEQEREAVLQVPPIVGPEIDPGEPQHRRQHDGKRIAPRQELAQAPRISARSLTIVPRVCTASMAIPPLSSSGGGGLPRSQAQKRPISRVRMI